MIRPTCIYFAYDTNWLCFTDFASDEPISKYYNSLSRTDNDEYFDDNLGAFLFISP